MSLQIPLHSRNAISNDASKNDESPKSQTDDSSSRTTSSSPGPSDPGSESHLARPSSFQNPNAPPQLPTLPPEVIKQIFDCLAVMQAKETLLEAILCNRSYFNECLKYLWRDLELVPGRTAPSTFEKLLWAGNISNSFRLVKSVRFEPWRGEEPTRLIEILSSILHHILPEVRYLSWSNVDGHLCKLDRVLVAGLPYATQLRRLELHSPNIWESLEAIEFPSSLTSLGISMRAFSPESYIYILRIINDTPTLKEWWPIDLMPTWDFELFPQARKKMAGAVVTMSNFENLTRFPDVGCWKLAVTIPTRKFIPLTFWKDLQRFPKLKKLTIRNATTQRFFRHLELDDLQSLPDNLEIVFWWDTKWNIMKLSEEERKVVRNVVGDSRVRFVVCLPKTTTDARIQGEREFWTSFSNVRVW